MIPILDIRAPDLNGSWDVTGDIFDSLTHIDDTDLGILLFNKNLQLLRLDQHIRVGISAVRDGECSLDNPHER